MLDVEFYQIKILVGKITIFQNDVNVMTVKFEFSASGTEYVTVMSISHVLFAGCAMFVKLNKSMV